MTWACIEVDPRFRDSQIADMKAVARRLGEPIQVLRHREAGNKITVSIKTPMTVYFQIGIEAWS